MKNILVEAAELFGIGDIHRGKVFTSAKKARRTQEMKTCL